MVFNRKLTNILHGQYKAHKKKKKILIQPITSMMKLSTHTTKTNITHLGKASVFFFWKNEQINNKFKWKEHEVQIWQPQQRKKKQRVETSTMASNT